jgi:hypothetical protein
LFGELKASSNDTKDAAYIAIMRNAIKNQLVSTCISNIYIAFASGAKIAFASEINQN